MYATPNYVRFQSVHRPEIFIGGAWKEVSIHMLNSIFGARPPRAVRLAINKIASGKATVADFNVAQNWIEQRYNELVVEPYEAAYVDWQTSGE